MSTVASGKDESDYRLRSPSLEADRRSSGAPSPWYPRRRPDPLVLECDGDARGPGQRYK